MATIQRFEDIQGWQKARELKLLVFELTKKPRFAQDRKLVEQIRNAASSVMSNIAEGFGRGGNREFRQFLKTAKASANEVRSQLYEAKDAGYILDDELQKALELEDATERLIAGFIRFLDSCK